MQGLLAIVSVFVILNRFDRASCLAGLSPFGDNVITENEALIRDTFDRVLDILNTAPDADSKLERHLSIHKHLLNTTLKDSELFKDIHKETRVFPVDEDTMDFTGVINEILNEDVISNDTIPDEQTQQVIESILTELKYLAAQYNNPKDQEKFILETLNQTKLSLDIIPVENFTTFSEESSENYTNPYWNPEDEISIKNRRIYHGKKTKIKNFPFVAAVLLFQIFYCAGSIISNDLIITAASCLQLAWNNRLFRENPSYISVRVGSSFHVGGGEVISIQEIYFHPSYDPKSLQSNICLLRMSRHLNFHGKKKNRIKKIMFDTMEHALPMNTPGVTIVGWGAKMPGNVVAFTDPLHYAVLDIYSLEDCRDIYSKAYVKKNNFCAGFISVGGGACNHDVGDPGVVDGILVGVVSFGSPVCGTPDAPTVFTKVGYYADWIEGIVDMKVPTGYASTTTTTRWRPTMPTEPPPVLHINLNSLTTQPDSVNDLLRTYFNHNEELYQNFVKTLHEKDTEQFVKALKSGSSSDATTNIPKPKVVPLITLPEESQLNGQIINNVIYKPTVGEAFEDLFEKIITEPHKKHKKHHKHKNKKTSKMASTTEDNLNIARTDSQSPKTKSIVPWDSNVTFDIKPWSDELDEGKSGHNKDKVTNKKSSDKHHSAKTWANPLTSKTPSWSEELREEVTPFRPLPSKISHKKHDDDASDYLADPENSSEMSVTTEAYVVDLATPDDSEKTPSVTPKSSKSHSHKSRLPISNLHQVAESDPYYIDKYASKSVSPRVDHHKTTTGGRFTQLDPLMFKKSQDLSEDEELKSLESSLEFRKAITIQHKVKTKDVDEDIEFMQKMSPEQFHQLLSKAIDVIETDLQRSYLIKE